MQNDFVDHLDLPAREGSADPLAWLAGLGLAATLAHRGLSCRLQMAQQLPGRILPNPRILLDSPARWGDIIAAIQDQAREVACAYRPLGWTRAEAEAQLAADTTATGAPRKDAEAWFLAARDQESGDRDGLVTRIAALSAQSTPGQMVQRKGRGSKAVEILTPTIAMTPWDMIREAGVMKWDKYVGQSCQIAIQSLDRVMAIFRPWDWDDRLCSLRLEITNTQPPAYRAAPSTKPLRETMAVANVMALVAIALVGGGNWRDRWRPLWWSAGYDATLTLPYWLEPRPPAEAVKLARMPIWSQCEEPITVRYDDPHAGEVGYRAAWQGRRTVLGDIYVVDPPEHTRDDARYYERLQNAILNKRLDIPFSETIEIAEHKRSLDPLAAFGGRPGNRYCTWARYLGVDFAFKFHRYLSARVLELAPASDLVFMGWPRDKHEQALMAEEAAREREEEAERRWGLSIGRL